MSLYNRSISKPRPRLGDMKSDLSPEVETKAQQVVAQSALPLASAQNQLVQSASVPVPEPESSAFPEKLAEQAVPQLAKGRVPVQVQLPDYVDDALRELVFKRRVTKRRLILEALASHFGIPIAEADMAEDGRRLRGKAAR
jgi:hypothetical protein